MISRALLTLLCPSLRSRIFCTNGQSEFPITQFYAVAPPAMWKENESGRTARSDAAALYTFEIAAN